MSDNWYERQVLPYLIHVVCGTGTFRHQRRQVVPAAVGEVLEIGLGTGLNLPFYDPGKVSRILGLEPSLISHHLADSRIQASPIPVELIALSAESIPLPDQSVDTVVCTYTLCTIPDPVAALHEMKRVLKPEGKLLFAEHGKAPQAEVFGWQNRLQPVWGKLAGGCHLNRDIPELFRQAGFHSTLQQGYVKGPKVFSYQYWGEAKP